MMLSTVSSNFGVAAVRTRAVPRSPTQATTAAAAVSREAEMCMKSSKMGGHYTIEPEPKTPADRLLIKHPCLHGVDRNALVSHVVPRSRNVSGDGRGRDSRFLRVRFWP